MMYKFMAQNLSTHNTKFKAKDANIIWKPYFCLQLAFGGTALAVKQLEVLTIMVNIIREQYFDKWNLDAERCKLLSVIRTNIVLTIICGTKTSCYKNIKECLHVISIKNLNCI